MGTCAGKLDMMALKINAFLQEKKLGRFGDIRIIGSVRVSFT